MTGSPAKIMRKAGLVAALAPILVALAARWATGGAPAAVHADVAPLDAAPTPVRLSERQLRAQAFALQSLDRALGPSPLRPLGTAEASPSHSDENDTPTPALKPAPTPKFIVSSVVLGSRQALATINGKLRRIGDEIEPGWTLEAIDKARDEIVIASDDGRRVVIPIRRRVR